MTTRRDFLAGSSLTLLGAALPHAARSSARAAAADEGSAVEAQTRYGRIRGQSRAGVCAFKGIPYGAPTGGNRRFQPPQAPAAWTGVRDCMTYGPVCPQRVPGETADPAAVVQSEDCLNLNLWTPAVDDGGRRPVLVILQGDGFVGGSANGPAGDGTTLASSGDLVVIGINHRLGRLGYLQLADAGAGAAFAQSGVAGLMDLVAALEWVRDHAEAFGGDPGRVTLLGQAGGGAQVSSLLATRAAQGLFHRAAVQSGSLLRFEPREAAGRQAAALLQALRMSRGGVTALQALPWQQLLSAPAGAAGSRPVLDGHYLTHDPFEAAAPEESATVPLIVSSMLDEVSRQFTNFGIDDAGLRAVLERRFPGRGREILSLYRRYYPDLPAFLLQAQAFTDAGPRRAALHQAELKAAQGKGAIYVYEWDWSAPGADSRYGAARGLDAATGLGNEVPPGAERLASQLASLWMSFARSGRPAVSQLPPWPGYDITTRATLVFGTPTQLINDPRGEIRQFWQHTQAQDTASV